jgi:aquaporin Z
MTAKLLTEGIGTFFLVLTIGLTVSVGAPLAPAAIGSALMVMVYMGWHISGAHYNPAVTLAVLLRGKVAGSEAGAYMIAQLGGAIVAALVVAVLRGDSLMVAPGPAASAIQILLVEILFSFALVLVVLNVATSPKTEGNSYYGLAIGFTVFVGATAGGDISGGAFNPAVGLGPAIAGALTGSGLNGQVALYYVVGPLVGGALAAGVFSLQHAEEARVEREDPG